ncbi:MAG: hypothetical protein M1829_001507 [Trizodia sp. TS-e1964]|nr:MAG: hypothetical protein M1829_001507 [Trizodia sp. TS-e1964]
MASSSARPERVYHQDYIARIRYANTLPPPSLPPKGLNVSNSSITKNDFVAASFAQRLSREQPLNIEVDGELGMPLDLVGMPGIFDGDESSIQAKPSTPTPAPNDRELLGPANSLGKKISATAGVSFLRRTEYISSEQGRARLETATSANLIKSTVGKSVKRKSEHLQDDPIQILQAVVKGFEIAYPGKSYPDTAGPTPTAEEVRAWSKPKHPKNPRLKLLDSYPLMPDLEGFTDSKGFIVLKFATNPVTPSEVYDQRLDVGLLRPLRLSSDIQARIDAAQAAHDADPSNPAPIPPPHEFEFYLPSDSRNVQNIKRRFDVDDPERNNPSLYAGSKKECFKYGRLRAYETTQLHSYPEGYSEVALTLHDPEFRDRKPPAKRIKQKGAYYYPIIQKTVIRPRRAINATMLGGKNSREMESDRVDLIELKVREPNDMELASLGHQRAEVDLFPEEI